jgi:hypothetical protein
MNDKKSCEMFVLEMDEETDCNFMNCFIFHASDANSTRFIWKFRVLEGEQGSLTAYIASERIPKTCQLVTFNLKSLSLHSSISEIPKPELKSDDNNHNINNRPCNKLDLEGDWSIRTFNSWLMQCLPDVPSRVTEDECSLCWKSTFVGSYLSAQFGNGSAHFQSDSVSTIAILQQFLTAIAIENNITMSNVQIC